MGRRRAPNGHPDLFIKSAVPAQQAVAAEKTAVTKTHFKKFPEVLVRARAQRRIMSREASQYASQYVLVVAELKKKFGLPPPKMNALVFGKYCNIIEKEITHEHAIAKSFSSTGADRDLIEAHQQRAEMMERYLDAIKHQNGTDKK